VGLGSGLASLCGLVVTSLGIRGYARFQGASGGMVLRPFVTPLGLEAVL
jgi:hypothetical protein